ncbi:hypothetical protein SAMN05216276_101045 [Streptosporangium subroseum]|uniref:Immunity protein 52 domain-containing protein n=1 Tax=Streptosporangium subroseum TaxID=106412 RepID=A0A239ESD5_9ACTN|nr:Imm52 family immunity protein [Streptosporangium subroseum]SNS47596.1 hypothetical protein SAMN05216276_101045 [Streptosporangium subroseum]
MRRLVRSFWGPRQESVEEVAARWTALLKRLGEIEPAVFGPWTGVSDFGPDPSVEVETEALAAYLRESNADDGRLDRTGYRLALHTSARQTVQVSISGSAGGLSELVPMVVVIAITAPDDSPSLPYTEILRALAESWDIDVGDVTDDDILDALEDDGLGPGDRSIGWGGYLSQRRAALLSDSGLSLPGKAEPMTHGGVLLDLSGVGTVEDLVALNRQLRATGALEPLPPPMDRRDRLGAGGPQQVGCSEAAAPGEAVNQGPRPRPTGRPFSVRDAVAAVEVLLTRPVPADGPTNREGDPDSGEWTGSFGAGFRLTRLWESRGYFGVSGPDWNAAQEESEAYLAALAAELEQRWGPHRDVSMRPYLFRSYADEPMPPLFAEICSFDLYGDLLVWGPLDTPEGQRWVAVSVSQCDEDAPHIMLAATGDSPVTEPDE